MNQLYPEFLYKTKSQHSSIDNPESHCVYLLIKMFYRVHTYIPYCFRTNNLPIADSIQGETFSSMYEKNRTSEELFFQYSSIDNIEDYEIYTFYRRLNKINPILEEQLYQRCEPPTFGHTCQYQFLSNDEFIDIVNNTFTSKRLDHPQDVLMITNGTCYQEIQCQGSIICLDWREVCDGYIQCPDGQDEEHCRELEINECDSTTEYRCNNGQCIPQELFFDKIPDCIDNTDESLTEIEFCHSSMHWYCENRMCDSHLYNRFSGTPMPFTCGDGQCREMSIISQIRPAGGASSLICGSGRDLLHTQQLFSSNDDCLEYIKCALANPLFSHDCNLKCSLQEVCLSRIQNACGNRSYITYPLKPIFHDHVFFIYELNPMTVLFYNYMPSLICFDAKRCSQYRTTINVNNKACSTIDQFKELQKLGRTTSWINIYAALYATFGQCALPGLISFNDSSCGHSSLFHCSNTSKCISRHRVQDNTVDCFTGEDETILSMCDQLPHRFSCYIDQRCIPRRFLMDSEIHCMDGSDEALGFRCIKSLSESCDILSGRRDANTETLFTTICNGIQEIQLKSNENDTDETDCSEYSCMSQYTICNGVWNCVDGRDEHFCENSLSSMYCDVEKNEFFCLQMINQTLEYCASVDKINDSQIDCLGSSDERDFCRKKYPFDFTQRYRCKNASICISPFQICDCYQDCPLNDDEEWPLCAKTMTTCPTRYFPCSDIKPGAVQQIDKSGRCDGVIYFCFMGEDEWLCDLIDQSEVKTFTSDNLLDFVPILPKSVSNESTRRLKLNWYCNRGIPVQSTVHNEEIKCLCSPAYYGDRCEYQRKRLSVILELRASTMIERASVFKLLISLVQISTGYVTYSTEIVYMPTVQCLPKHIMDLLYPLSWQITDQHYVRISIFHLTQKSKQIHYQGSWYYPIQFEFLPVNRFVTQITLTENGNPKMLSHCEHLPCVHGRCELYLNRPNYYFCHCDPPWFGRLCDVRTTEEYSCAPDSICIAPDICICPLDKIGSRCYVPFDPCRNLSCGEHGHCLPSDIRTNEWICVCNEQYFGDRCQYNASTLNISFASNIQIPRAVLIHFVSLSSNTERKVRSYFRQISLQQNEAVAFYPEEFMSNVIFVQLFDESITDSLHLVFLNNDDTQISYKWLYVEISKSNQCPAINKIFDSKFVQLPFLRRVKFYQRPCQNKTTKISCFYDEMHICICNKFQQVDCIPFVIANTIAQCPIQANPCKNGGICMQDEKQCPKASICVCPPCAFGRLCQFSIKPYSLSLEAIIGQLIRPNVKLYHQPASILMAATITGIMFSIGLIDVGLCLTTFSQKCIRSTGRGFYLLFLSLVSFGNISAFLLQLVFLLIEQIHSTSSYAVCLINHFLLKFFPIVSNWTQACASVESICIIYYGLQYRKELSYRTAKYIIIVIVLISFLMCMHDPFYRALLYDDFEQRIWCIVSFPSALLKTYDSMITTIHYIAVFGINIFSAMAIIVLTARIRAKTNKNYRKTLWKSLEQNKHLLMSPILLVLLSIPRLIIAWLTTCAAFNGRSEPFLMLAGFYVGYLPNVISTVIFILPSKMYRQQLIRVLQHSIRRVLSKQPH